LEGICWGVLSSWVTDVFDRVLESFELNCLDEDYSVIGFCLCMLIIGESEDFIFLDSLITFLILLIFTFLNRQPKESSKSWRDWSLLIHFESMINFGCVADLVEL
jgi:hypothetical protein